MSLKSIDVVHQFRVILGRFSGTDQLEAEQNWCQWIAEFVRRYGEKVVASFDCFAQFFDQQFNLGTLNCMPAFGHGFLRWSLHHSFWSELILSTVVGRTVHDYGVEI